MKHTKYKNYSFVLLCLLLFFIPFRNSYSQASYPIKPIKIYVGFSPGGFTDFAARLIAQKLSHELGQPVLVENKTGANGLIAGDATSKAAPDGYILFLSSIGLTTNPILYEKMWHDPVKDFTSISLLATVPNILVVHPKIQVKNLQELIQFSKISKDLLTQASAGNASPGHLSGAMLQVMANIKFEHIPYKGTGQAMSDLLAGNVDLSFPVFSTAYPHIKAGKLKAIAITSAKRSPMLPDTPTIAEAGLPGYETGGWYGLVGPPGMQNDVTTVLSKNISLIMKMTDVRDRFVDEGAEPIGSNSAQMSEFLAKDFKRWGDVIKASNIKASNL